MRKGRGGGVDCRIRVAAGLRWHELRISMVGDWRLVIARDIDAPRRAHEALQQQLERQMQMLDASVDCIKLINLDGSVRHMNRSGCIALGVPVDEEAFGMPWLGLLPPEVTRPGQRALRQAAAGRNARFAGKSVIAGQKAQYWDNILTPMRGADGAVSGILCVSRDITLQREAELRLRVASDCDELTGLPNRRSFNRQLRSALARCRERGRGLGLMIIDLDHFKHINDTLGHPAGDHLLRVLARRIDALMPEGATLARLGGDEFAVIHPHVGEDEGMLQLARKLQRAADVAVTYAGQAINGGLSIGCAVFPRDARDAAGLMKAADTALNDIKANGRGGVQVYSSRLMAIAEFAAGQRKAARQLVRERAVLPYYQRKVRMEDGRVVGFEALLRWVQPDTGRVEDSCMLDEAFKDYELATRLSEMMQEQVLADINAWRALGTLPLPVAINAAPVEFLRDDFAERLLARLARHAVPPALVEIEVTEQMLTERGAGFVVRALRKLKLAGMRIALDDFGTGHSSLSHLRDYPIDCLKLDRSFVSRMGEETSIRAIVEAVGKLGPSLGLELIAEGVETPAQRDRLRAAGYAIGQGYLYAPALTAAEAAQAAARWYAGTRDVA